MLARSRATSSRRRSCYNAEMMLLEAELMQEMNSQAEPAPDRDFSDDSPDLGRPELEEGSRYVISE